MQVDLYFESDSSQEVQCVHHQQQTSDQFDSVFGRRRSYSEVIAPPPSLASSRYLL